MDAARREPTAEQNPERYPISDSTTKAAPLGRGPNWRSPLSPGVRGRARSPRATDDDPSKSCLPHPGGVHWKPTHGADDGKGSGGATERESVAGRYG
jgi:hypothetical protein